MSKGTLLSLDPSQRLVIDLAKDESIEEHSRKIYEALSEDLFSVRLKQMAWDAFIKNPFKKNTIEKYLNKISPKLMNNKKKTHKRAHRFG